MVERGGGGVRATVGLVAGARERVAPRRGRELGNVRGGGRDGIGVRRANLRDGDLAGSAGEASVVVALVLVGVEEERALANLGVANAGAAPEGFRPRGRSTVVHDCERGDGRGCRAMGEARTNRYGGVGQESGPNARGVQEDGECAPAPRDAAMARVDAVGVSSRRAPGATMTTTFPRQRPSDRPMPTRVKVVAPRACHLEAPARAVRARRSSSPRREREPARCPPARDPRTCAPRSRHTPRGRDVPPRSSARREDTRPRRSAPSSPHAKSVPKTAYQYEPRDETTTDEHHRGSRVPMQN